MSDSFRIKGSHNFKLSPITNSNFLSRPQRQTFVLSKT